MIFEHETHTGKLTATLPNNNSEADNSTEVYFCLSSICMNPFCDCNDVFLELHHLSSGEVHKIGINIKEKALIERENTAVINAFSKQLFDLLDDGDFKVLRTIYVVLKQHASDKTDVSELAVDFPRHEIEQQNLMIIYNEIFPYGSRFRITIEDVLYLLIDHYCVKNNCSCTKTMLSFYPILNEDVEQRMEAEVEKMAFSISMDYQAKTWKFEHKPETDPLATEQVQAALENKYDSFYAKVQQRHERLKQMYGDYLTRIQPAKSQKIGRNDACPCGSGKKYKKCCGAGGTLLA